MFAAAVIMGAAALLAYDAIGSHISSGRLAAVAAIAFGGLVYLAVIILIRGFKREDILNMPKGEKIAEILTKWKLL